MQNLKTPAVESRVNEILSRMTLAEKAAQMVQVPFAYVSREEARDWATRGAGFAGYDSTGGSALCEIIQSTPKRSVSMPKVPPHGGLA